MVHIKRIELTHFKSFGGHTSIPILPGFTVISGPNGSGKSNILDGVLFCLGLATSKGMRAERLPDLVNNNAKGARGSSEASVSVTFDISDLDNEEFFAAQRARYEPALAELSQTPQNGADLNPEILEKLIPQQEWTVTRRLKITKGGNYSSSYFINGEAASAGELHEQLSRLRIYPEGYNIVLQGDVTRIITMNPKERREIIDELAGVAEFDRKIVKTKETLEEAREREERCRIIETELLRALERLGTDAVKAQKYQKLREQVQEKQRLSQVIQVKALSAEIEELGRQYREGERELGRLNRGFEELAQEIASGQSQLTALNAQVRALGEEDQIRLTARLAQYQAQQEQLRRRREELRRRLAQGHTAQGQAQKDLLTYQERRRGLGEEIAVLEQETLPRLRGEAQTLQDQLDAARREAQILAEASSAWVEEQTRQSRAAGELQNALAPLRQEAAQLRERVRQLESSLTTARETLAQTESRLAERTGEAQTLSAALPNLTQQAQSLAARLALAEQEKSVLQETQGRLSKEQREKQRQLDKLEATQQAQGRVEGAYAAQTLLNSGLPGLCGLVAQLGQVESQYQLALEIAAGARLGFMVVEDDSVAAAGIALLKQSRAGRATFLPLTKIRGGGPRGNPLSAQTPGYIDLAFNLVRFDPRYREIFAFVFGQTLVFETLDLARPHLGRQRIVTLEGELLETSGALSGGSRPARSGLRFGAVTQEESPEMEALRRRLGDLEQICARNEEHLLEREVLIKELTPALNEARQTLRERQLELQGIEQERQRLSQQSEVLHQQIQSQGDALEAGQIRLAQLEQEIPPLERRLAETQTQLAALETSASHQDWQRAQGEIQTREQAAGAALQELQGQENRLGDLRRQGERLEEQSAQAEKILRESQTEAQSLGTQEAALTEELAQTQSAVEGLEQELAGLAERLGAVKQERDALERQVQNRQNQRQQTQWQGEKLQETQRGRETRLAELRKQLADTRYQISDIESDLASDLGGLVSETGDYRAALETLEREIRAGQKKLEAMEPVNMLALEEQTQTQARLSELQEKLNTIEAERTELLLRVENFTTLRLRAFQAAFSAVNENFQTIFAQLSDGDGYLQLDNPEDPFQGGLNLVAHPKGKPVQRLSSMSGGEKSLTALSFIFALQRYRPSPFYGFDEVDMFLDGANVEKLSKMVRQQAQQAQFLVVSLRRPMISAAERTIGVTQARGAHTQVIGIKL
ncbi:MAG: chromosome segregation protein SMC [Cyanobacteria bacterium RI_101]|nr:chromosome segregation protein SMC [Cyanobacteria bacterium RI_101]